MRRRFAYSGLLPWTRDALGDCRPRVVHPPFTCAPGRRHLGARPWGRVPRRSAPQRPRRRLFRQPQAGVHLRSASPPSVLPTVAALLPATGAGPVAEARRLRGNQLADRGTGRGTRRACGGVRQRAGRRRGGQRRRRCSRGRRRGAVRGDRNRRLVDRRPADRRGGRGVQRRAAGRPRQRRRVGHRRRVRAVLRRRDRHLRRLASDQAGGGGAVRGGGRRVHRAQGRHGRADGRDQPGGRLRRLPDRRRARHDLRSRGPCDDLAAGACGVPGRAAGGLRARDRLGHLRLHGRRRARPGGVAAGLQRRRGRQHHRPGRHRDSERVGVLRLRVLPGEPGPGEGARARRRERVRRAERGDRPGRQLPGDPAAVHLRQQRVVAAPRGRRLRRLLPRQRAVADHRHRLRPRDRGGDQRGQAGVRGRDAQ